MVSFEQKIEQVMEESEPKTFNLDSQPETFKMESEPKTFNIEAEPIVTNDPETFKMENPEASTRPELQQAQVEVNLKQTMTQKPQEGKEGFTIVIKKNIFSGFVNVTKEFFMNLKQKITANKDPKTKADKHIQLCWNFMARNDVENARTEYDKLRSVYETMEDGADKHSVYYEVYDIYSRLSEIKV